MIARITKIAALFLVFIAVAGACAYFTLTFLIKSEDSVIVPDFIGKDVVYVLEYLTELGLNTKVKGSEYSTDVPKNHVIFQEPEPGAEIKKDRDVRIIISKGAKTVLMPNLTGLSFLQAQIIFEENDLCQGQQSRAFNRDLERETIISQSPLPGDSVQRGKCVDLLVSLGQRPNAYKMPELAGFSLEDAILLIEKFDLPLGEVKSLYDKNMPPNTVVNQHPLAGYRVEEGKRVNLVINRKQRKKDQEYLSGEQKRNIFTYRLDNGFLRRHIRVELKSNGFSSDLFDGFLKPGEEIWLLIPTNKEATVLLYEDDRLIQTQVYDVW
ncbi:MAG: PASTA domain-containing protein [Desulfobacterales bacterium]|jgi:serine/threonine-protein kinase